MSRSGATRASRGPRTDTKRSVAEISSGNTGGASRLIGMDKVLRNLTLEVHRMTERVEQGMIAAGQYIQAGAQENTPVDTGALRASARTTWERKPGSITVCVSYGMYYSIFVHERPASHEVGDWKYLERAITENWDSIIQIVAKNSRLRK